ncbi:MAG: M14 family metallopeptidase, partial [Bacteroidota bacterium]|nr:M14 family metallopeptidase [Bacteroidota bacterium]
MKKLFLFLILLQGINSFAQKEKYSRIKIFTDEKGISQLASAGLSMEHGEMKKGFWFISDFSETEMAIVKQQGFSMEILIDDVKKFYKEQNLNQTSKSEDPGVSPLSIGCKTPPVYPTPTNFSLGSMGGFFTYSEIMWHMDNLATLFPSIVKAKSTIGVPTIEGRPMYWMKISDNPLTDETEPEVFYNSAHHAREPASVSQLILYMYYLCENYAGNPEVQYLVNNSEMYFMPLTNPDGYVYNETTDPAGGGMWRKNRRDNGGGSFGVDINRNYGYNWAYDNVGSSPSKWSETYRGTAAFSEAESQNIRDFSNAHTFRLSLNNHTYGNLLIYSYGYAPAFMPDSAQFYEYGSHLTTYNKYSFGTAPQTVLYPTNGSVDDWQYGEQISKPKIFGMTPEAGRSDEGFWPPSSRIVDICKENIWQNLHLVHLALKYAAASDDEPNYIPTTSGFLNYKLQRLGMEDPATYTVSIVPIGPEIASVGAPKSYSTLNMLDEVSDSISFTLNPIVPGTVIRYMITVDNGLYTFSDTIVKKFGNPVIIFASDGNSMTGWSSPNWDISNST